MGVNGIYGLSGSGMDIESMVKVGMMSKQNEYDKMAQKYTKNEWMKADYLELSNKITTFNSSTLSQYKMSNTMNAKSAESSSAAVKVTANSTAAIMSHQVEVTSLSSNAYLVGTNKLTRYSIATEKLDDNTADQSSLKLADVLFETLRDKGDGSSYSGSIAKVTAPSGVNNSADDNYNLATTDYRFGREQYKNYSYTGNYEKYDKATGALLNGDTRPTSSDYTLDPSVWTSNTVDNGDGTTTTTYQKLNSTTGLYEDATPTSADYNYLDPAVWKSYGWRERDNTAVTGDMAAFTFTIYDGTETKAMENMTTAEKEAYKKAHTISYSFDQLLGNDGEAKTFYDLVSDINAISGLNIKASYDAEHDTFSFYNTKGGKANTINIVLDADTNKTTNRAAVTARNFFDNLGLYQSANGKLTGEDEDAPSVTAGDTNSLLFELNANNAYTGSDGNIKIDGVDYSTTENKATVGGITYTALNETSTLGPATVSVTQDTAGIIDKVKSFVSEYNTLLSSLYEKYDEKPNSDYKPLTQSQKEQMKDEQIEKWEEKAKKGLLYHDQTLGKIIQNMRDAVSESVGGISSKYDSVYSIGISTTGIKGQLVIDEDKLKRALSEDPDSVYNIFAKLESTSTDASSATYSYQRDSSGNVISGTRTVNGNGVAQRLGDIFVNARKLIQDRAGSSADITEDSDLNNLLRNLQTKMSNFKKLMTSFEDALYKKYDAMESTLARLGTQLNYVMGSTGA